ncbi:MAG: single-stranded DNA-binding protein [Alphaproteobacteria bacterium]|nr:single-stranded DNA-binding protein [Alphaproteobacteria bacterium]
MDRAQFEFIGNVGKIEIKPLKEGKKLAILSVATSERWKPESGDWIEKTYWHRVAVFAAAKIALIEAAVQKGTRLRLVGQVRPNSWEDERGMTRYSVEFIVGVSGDVEILARGKPRTEEPPAPGPEAPAKARRAAAGKAAAGEAATA